MIGVVIATYGDRDRWAPLVERAAASVGAQDCGPLARHWEHGDDLASARNAGARALAGGDEPVDWLIFLDADDELDVGYVTAMSAAVDHDRALYRPNTIGIYADGHTDPEPCMIKRSDMKTRNCAVIGTMVPAALFHEVGGFRPYPTLEDWALWRCMLAAGAGLVDVPAAVYRVHVSEHSRNAPSAEMNATYRRIIRECPL